MPLIKPNVIERQHIGAHEVKDQKHLSRPATNATNGHQLVDDGFVIHVGPFFDLQRPAVKVQG